VVHLLVLVLVPGTPLLMSVLAWNVALRRPPAKGFMELRAQLAADAQALRTIRPRP
jgi:hypothetical protein